MKIEDSFEEKNYQRRDIERVIENKRRLMEIQNDFYEKQLKKEFMKRELTDDEAKNDVIRAKENKERVEKMQAQYFLQKYDLRLSFENKKKVKEIQQKHLEDIQLKENQKKDIELVKKNKRRFIELQKEYYEKRLTELHQEEMNVKTIKIKDESRRDIINVKLNKIKAERLQAEYFLKRYDILLVKENKQRLEEIKKDYYQKRKRKIHNTVLKIPTPPYIILNKEIKLTKEQETITKDETFPTEKIILNTPIEEKEKGEKPKSENEDIKFRSLNHTNHEGNK